MEIKKNKTAAALGLFDGLHLGHIEVIKAALAAGENGGLTPAVFTFNSLTPLPKLKKAQNIIDDGLKLTLMKDIGVGLIIARDFAEVRDLSASEFVEKIIVSELNAGFVACGWDFRFAKGAKADAAELKRLCAAHGVKTRVVPAVTVDGKTVSSTLIRKYIKDGDIKNANKMLGYELMYESVVIEGNQFGRTLGAPTANQVIPDGNVMPMFGVYKSWVVFNGRNYPAVTNIGVKPTVSGDGQAKPLMETHIIGFDGDLYGQVIRVCLRDFVRGEKKFNDVYELKRQIGFDKEAAMV